MRVKLVIVLFGFISFLFSQETHNLEIIWQKTGDTTFILGYGFLSKCPGDVNGDGYFDILYYGNERSWAGRAYLFYGGNNIDTIPDAVFSNSNGYDAICMGDFNGDRFDDIAIGNILDFGGYGGITIYLGSNPVDTIIDYKFREPQVGSNFGCAVSSGDVNGDSFSDLIIGAYGYANDKGRVYIYLGGSNFDTIPDVILDGGHNNDPEAFGRTVSGSGDVNNDGYDDIIIGAMNFDHDRGRIYIYFGGNPMNTIYDVAMAGEERGHSLGEADVDFINNCQTFDHAITGTPFWGPITPPVYTPGKVYVLFGSNLMDSVPDIWMTGRTAISFLGTSIACAGDLNMDGCDEIISGAVNEPGEYTGTAYVWLGGTMFDTIPDAWMKGVIPDQDIGRHVASAGDVNGDNKDEVMISNSAGRNPSVWVCKYTGPGIEEERLTHNTRCLTLEINPNPAKGVIRIRCLATVQEIKIFNVSGKLMKEIASASEFASQSIGTRFALRNDGMVKISLKGISPGIYFLRFGKETKKFLVVR